MKIKALQIKNCESTNESSINQERSKLFHYSHDINVVNYSLKSLLLWLFHKNVLVSHSESTCEQWLLNSDSVTVTTIDLFMCVCAILHVCARSWFVMSVTFVAKNNWDTILHHKRMGEYSGLSRDHVMSERERE